MMEYKIHYNCEINHIHGHVISTSVFPSTYQFRPSQIGSHTFVVYNIYDDLTKLFNEERGLYTFRFNMFNVAKVLSQYIKVTKAQVN